MKANSVTANATQQVLATNEFNDPPAAGHQFFMASITATYTGPGSADAGSVIDYLDAVGASNISYTQFTTDGCGVLPDPDYMTAYSGVNVFTGGSVTGNICWSVPSTDAASLEMYNDQTPQVWFALH